jgi:predicted nucleic-acid-binding Zn-ribbon protein
MKRKKLLIYVLAVFAAAFTAQSCGTNLGETITVTKTKLENALASKTELVIDEMVDVYSQIDELSFQSEYDNALAGVLADMHGEFQSDLTDTVIRKKIYLLTLYKQAVQEYALLADDGFTGKQSAFSKCCTMIQKEFSVMGDTVAAAYAKSINSYLKTPRYDQNDVAKILLKALQSVWEEDVKNFNEKLSSDFSAYQSLLAQMPGESFSEEKLTKYVYQPYAGKKNLVEAYKLNLIKERRQALRRLVQQQDNISSSVYCINCALTEFLKKDCDKTTVQNYLNRIDILLEDKEVNENEN